MNTLSSILRHVAGPRSGGLRWLLAVALAVPVRGTAQVRAEFGPVLGYYRPYGSFEAASVYFTSLPFAPSDLKGLARGAEGRVWLGQRVGIELRGFVASSTLPSVSTPSGPSRPTPANVYALTAQTLLTIVGTASRHLIWVSAGAGVSRHGGEAYARHTGVTDIGPAAGFGTRFRLTRQIHATAGVTAFTYMFDMPMPADERLNPGSLQRGRQVDVLFHTGVSWTITHH